MSRYYCDSDKCRDFKPRRRVEKFNIEAKHKGMCPDCGYAMQIGNDRVKLRYMASSPAKRERQRQAPPPSRVKEMY